MPGPPPTNADGTPIEYNLPTMDELQALYGSTGSEGSGYTVGGGHDYREFENGTLHSSLGGITFQEREARVKDDWHQQRWSGGWETLVTLPDGTQMVFAGKVGSQGAELSNSFHSEPLTAETLGDGGFGEEGLEYSDLEELTPMGVFLELQRRGMIPEGDSFEEWEDDIRAMPIHQGVSEEDMAEYTAGVAEDVYGFETDIARAKEDIGTAGESSRSDIYGLQGGAAQNKRAEMFGKGLGGGMSQLNQQDASSAMRASGQGIMQGLTSDVRGKRRGIEDATTGLYGVGGTGMNNLGEGGIYGTGGTKDTDLYNLQKSGDEKWEGEWETWLSNNIQD